MRHSTLLSFLVGLIATVSCRGQEGYSRQADALGGSPAYVQNSWVTPQTPVSSLALALSVPQVSSDLLVVFIGWGDTSAAITTVTDSRGDTFALAAGPTKRTTTITQSAYYAKNIAGGSNTVTVHFNKAAKFVDLRVLEYSGLDSTAPFDTSASATGTGAQASATLTTHFPGELLAVGDTTLTGSISPGAGFTARLVTDPDDDLAEDRITGNAGSYTATAPILAPSGWVMQALAFKPRVSADAGVDMGSSAGGSGAGGSGLGGSGVGGDLGNGGSFADAGSDVGADVFDAGSGGAFGVGGSGVGGSGIGGSGIGGSGVGGSGTGGSGTGGAIADAGTGACFPLHVTGRYLTDACGKPFLLAGDAPMCLSANLTPANMDAYFATRAAQGFNAAWVNMLCAATTGGRANASTYDGILPFTGMIGGQYDLSKPNPAYFTRMDTMLSAAAAHGILVFLDPIEFTSFYPTILANGFDGCRAYGHFLGARWSNQGNIVWLQGNDLAGFSGVGNIAGIQLGIQDAGALQPQTAELDWPALPSTLDDIDFWAPFGASSINLAYTYNPTYALLLHDYDRADHVANIFIEGDYEGEALNSAPRLTNGHDVRAQAWWTDLSGATGQFYGNHWEVFALDNATFASNFAIDKGPAGVGHLQNFLMSRKWWTLVPDEAHTVLTSGLGSCMAASATQGVGSPREQDNDCAVAARASDGTLVVAYLPTARNVTVNLGQLSVSATARWYDPTTGAFTAISGSPFANSGSHVFTPPSGSHSDGSSDWVLVLE